MKKKNIVAILSVMYGIVVYFRTVVFFMYRNWAPADMEDYQTELDFLIQELSKHNPNAYLILILNTVLVFIICYYLYVGLKKIIKHLKTKDEMNNA